MTKADIRKEILAKRDSLTPEEQQEKSRQIFEKLITLEEYKHSRNILVYADFGSEVKTDDIILDSLAMGKNVYCPKVTDHENGLMVFAKIGSLEDLELGFVGLREPNIDDLTTIFHVNDSIDGDIGRTLVILPGVAFDRNLNRIGYNGGFYDRFLEKNSKLETVAIAYDIQVVDYEIPCEFHDKKPNKIVTESEIILTKT
ncbi:MAG: 5-formyltetrahydrofolate cyclo-ligase [Butyrivibrio sp.]|nr:5-formyltetrahydrofolate cyclo-ligase [Butyrivibrio sp.]